MKKRSTQKNKTRNFRKTNRGGTRGTKSTARSSTAKTSNRDTSNVYEENIVIAQADVNDTPDFFIKRDLSEEDEEVRKAALQRRIKEIIDALNNKFFLRNSNRVNLNRKSYQASDIGSGDKRQVYVSGHWNDEWTKTLEIVIAPGLIGYMIPEKNIKKRYKNLLLYKIYWQAYRILYRSSEKDDAKKNIIPLIDDFILLYTPFDKNTVTKLNV